MISLGYTSVTSDDIVIVTVPSHITHGRDDVIQCVKIHVDFKAYTWSFRVGQK